MRKAFTLVELMVVVVIAIILVAVTLPSVKYAIDEGKLREGARQFNAYFAIAKARATTTGRPAGVWLELEKIGDPAASPGLYQCSQLYLAEVPAPYSGDVQNALCIVEIGRPGTPADSPPWSIDFQGTATMLSTLISVGETFQIQLDHKGEWFSARRTSTDYEIVGPVNGVRPPRVPDFGPDKRPGVFGTDDDGNGTTDFVDLNGDGVINGIDDNGDGLYDRFDYWDLNELLWPGSDDRNLPRSYQIWRQPVRAGQPLELPQGIVIDTAYSGAGPGGNQLAAATARVLVMFSPQGGVASVSYIDASGAIVEDTGTSKLHFLVGRTEQVENSWQNVTASNIADGSNLWVTVNRRNGSVGTVENAPNVTLPAGTSAERIVYLTTAREFSNSGEIKGGQ